MPTEFTRLISDARCQATRPPNRQSHPAMHVSQSGNTLLNLSEAFTSSHRGANCLDAYISYTIKHLEHLRDSPSRHNSHYPLLIMPKHRAYLQLGYLHPSLNLNNQYYAPPHRSSGVDRDPSLGPDAKLKWDAERAYPEFCEDIVLYEDDMRRQQSEENKYSGMRKAQSRDQECSLSDFVNWLPLLFVHLQLGALGNYLDLSTLRAGNCSNCVFVIVSGD
ncbi:hypothetical protein BDV93DRAFT_543541 [Ceratobasidium sp. AG-I]|nr:hypothetical protein BDV93DRAFT_543541 [Ceratobasidium sp. AG-I]